MNPIKVLLVDDEEEFTAGLSKVLRRRGFEVEVAGDAATALSLTSGRTFDVALLDVKMPGMDGIQLMGELHRRSPSLPIILMTGHLSVGDEQEEPGRGAFAYLLKPHPIPELIAVIQRAAQSAGCSREDGKGP